MLTVTTLYADRNLLRLLVTATQNPDGATLSNADLLQRMEIPGVIPGTPSERTDLRTVWDEPALTKASARLRCTESGWNRIAAYRRSGSLDISVDVDTDPSGRPVLVLATTGDPINGACVVDLERRLRLEELGAATPEPSLPPGF